MLKSISSPVQKTIRKATTSYQHGSKRCVRVSMCVYCKQINVRVCVCMCVWVCVCTKALTCQCMPELVVAAAAAAAKHDVRVQYN